MRKALLAAAAFTLAACSGYQLDTYPQTNLPLPPNFVERQNYNAGGDVGNIVRDSLNEIVDIVAVYNETTKELKLGGPVRDGTNQRPAPQVLKLVNDPPIYNSVNTTNWSAGTNIPFAVVSASSNQVRGLKIVDLARIVVPRESFPTQLQLRGAAGPVQSGQKLVWVRGALLTRVEQKLYAKVQSGGRITAGAVGVNGDAFQETDQGSNEYIVSLFLTPIDLLAPGTPGATGAAPGAVATGLFVGQEDRPQLLFPGAKLTR